MAEHDNMQFRDDDFVLVQENVKISDRKIETKPTTFMKDAFKRFTKNKSSVVGAIILGFLILLAIIVPIVSPYDIDNVKTPEAFLAPKLFKSGTGFWDGTRKKTGIVYDVDNGVPALSDKYSVSALKNSVSELVIDESPTLTDAANKYGHNGYVAVATDSAVADKNSVMASKSTLFTSNGNYKLSFELLDEDNAFSSKLGEYRVYLSDAEGNEIILRDWSKEYGKIDIDLSRILADSGKDSVNGEGIRKNRH